MNRTLLATTYHWVKRLEEHGPPEYNQHSWRCPAGMCFASWLVVLSGDAAWLTPHDRANAHRLLATSEDHPFSRVEYAGVVTIDVLSRALRVSGVDATTPPAERARVVTLFFHLIRPELTLAEIRTDLTAMLGTDPEDLPPDEFVLSTYAKDDWTLPFDPALAERVRAWKSCGCTCPRCHASVPVGGD